MSPIDSAEKLVAKFNKPQILFDGNEAYYYPLLDEIHLPAPATFDNSESYYKTLFHELIHSTGHPIRIRRMGMKNYSAEERYSQEELIAEFGCSFLCAEAGIDIQFNDSAAYIQSWIAHLRDDPDLLYWASFHADIATKYCLTGKKPKKWKPQVSFSDIVECSRDADNVKKRNIEVRAPRPMFFGAWNQVNVKFPLKLYPDIPTEVRWEGEEQIDFERKTFHKQFGEILIHVKASTFETNLQNNEFTIQLTNQSENEHLFEVKPLKRKAQQKIIFKIFDLDSPLQPAIGLANFDVIVKGALGENTSTFIQIGPTKEQQKLSHLLSNLENTLRLLINMVMESNLGSNWLNNILQNEKERLNEILKRDSKNIAIARQLNQLGNIQKTHALDWRDYHHILGKPGAQYFSKLFEPDYAEFKKILLRANDWRTKIAHNVWPLVDVEVYSRDFNYLQQTLNIALKRFEQK